MRSCPEDTIPQLVARTAVAGSYIPKYGYQARIIDWATTQAAAGAEAITAGHPIHQAADQVYARNGGSDQGGDPG